jgi:leucine dehydrogenase
MSVLSHFEFDQHEKVVFVTDKESGLKAIIAVHNTTLGPSLGGCRMWPYASEEEAITDVLRLSKGMTYKSAIAGLPLGGGKCVIVGDPNTQKTPKLLQALGRHINDLNGSYITAEDSGTSVPDMHEIAKTTDYVSGICEHSLAAGDPSPSTALGVFLGIKAAVKFRFKQEDLQGLTVGVQGLGNVGFHLCELLHNDGASLLVTDINTKSIHSAVQAFEATPIACDKIYAAPMDVFAPCAMGGIINAQSLAVLNAKIIAGAANNQLSSLDINPLLLEKGILYAPDYVINAGGIIDIAHQRNNQAQELISMRKQIENIADTLTKIFLLSEKNNTATQIVADQLADQIINHKRSLNQVAV